MPTLVSQTSFRRETSAWCQLFSQAADFLVKILSCDYSIKSSLSNVHSFQVTNQMITACKSYITEHGYKTVWDYQQEELVAKLKNCIRLNEEYQRCFQKTKQRLEENPDERQFEFSEMYIFGKINTFARRLHKIIEMLDTMKAFSCLGESRIEGMEQLWNKFVLIVTTMRKKPYDLLDYRKMDFDADFEEFKRQINDLQVSLLSHLQLKLLWCFWCQFCSA